MNKLLELKIRELKILKKNIEIKDNIVYLKDKNIIIIGCDECYAISPTANKKGYEIPAGNLVNLYEKNSNLNIPVEISSNCWLCPKCGRLFKELLPQFITGDINNVSL